MHSLNGRHDAGFSIVEMMVAVVIGLFLLGGAVSMLVTSKRTYAIQEDLARIQENARFATEFMARDLRMAGYFGCAHNLGELFNHVNFVNAGELFDISIPVEGYEQDTAAWLPSANNTVGNILPGTDGITVRYMQPSDITVTNPMPQPSAVLQITTDNELEQGDIVAVSDCESADVFQISGPADDQPSTTGQLVHNTGAATAPGNHNNNFTGCPGAASNCLSKVYDTDARIMQLAAYRYYVGDDGNGNPALFRATLELDPATKTIAETPVQLIDGVENLQILWGVDTTGDRVPDEFIDANDNTGGVDLTNPDDWTNVVAARIALLLRSVDEVAPNVDRRADYVVGNETLGPFNDRRRRRVFTTTVFMRNLPNLQR